jgi:sterol desaturase/sphingolipid hydroxylase (fatty acid hydroxylase superfamily)
MSSQELAEIISNTFVTLAFISLFGLLALEKKKPKLVFPKSTSKESVLTNLTAFFFNNVILTLIRATSLFFVAQEFSGHGLLRGMEEGPLKWLLTFAMYDLAIYFWHLINHHNEFLWRFHKVHHSDQAFNVTTGFRFHVIDLLIEIPYKCLFVILVGVDAHIVLAMEAIQLVFILFHHANSEIPRESSISRVLITPALHRAHHSAARHEHDSNYGIVFSVWDQIFGTRLEAIPEKIGLKIIMAENFIQLICLGLLTEKHFRKVLSLIPNSARK